MVERTLHNELLRRGRTQVIGRLTRVALLVLPIMIGRALSVLAAQPAPTCEDARPTMLPPGNAKLSVVLDPGSEWQPRGGQVKVIVSGPGISLSNAAIIACFHWRNSDDKSVAVSLQDIRVIDVQSNAVTLGITVPGQLSGAPEFWWWKRVFSGEPGTGAYTGLGLVPLADLRLIVSAADASPPWLPLDATVPVGITSRGLSFLIVLASVAVGWTFLWCLGKLRGVPGSGPILKIISTKRGFASLSQLQIILWSFVVGGSAMYVMALSGTLIDITQGTLVLLGITGVSTVGSKLQSYIESQAGTNNIPPPAAVLSLLAKAPLSDAATEAVLSWQEPSGGGPVAEYAVRYRVTGTSGWIVASDALRRPGFRITGLAPLTSYELEVFGKNTGGEGPSATATLYTSAGSTSPGALGAVQNFRQKGLVSSSEIGTAWDNLAGENGYVLQYRAHDSADEWNVAARTVRLPSFVVSGLEPRTLYDFRIAGTNKSSAAGQWSKIISVRTWPRRPRWSDLIVTGVGDTEVDVTRVQMLFFTVISAIFVSLKVITSSAIPEIPDGFLLLMGISNGVYITAKFVPS